MSQEKENNNHDAINTSDTNYSSRGPHAISFSLSDVDECATNNGGCEHSCVNTYQSFTCVCRQGYTLGGDKKTCQGN